MTRAVLTSLVVAWTVLPLSLPALVVVFGMLLGY